MAAYPPSARTTNATPQVIVGFGPVLEEDEVCRGTIYVFASDHGAGAAYWEIRMLLRRMAGQIQSGIFTTVVDTNSPSAATWAVAAAIAANGQVQVTVTGEAGKTIDWLAVTDDVLCMHGEFGS